MLTHQQLSEAYKYACEIELRAFKPGNVSIYADGHDMTVEDFRISAQQSANAWTALTAISAIACSTCIASQLAPLATLFNQ
jgi:triphosphoribosyl-dephospho-CoA synthetase